MQSAFMNCLGKPIAVYEFGEVSNPALLFIHGNSAPSAFFLPLIHLLESKYHIVTLDLPGHNQSKEWEKEDFSIQNLSLLFNSVLDHFSIQEAAAFGFSMGGLLLLECFDLMPAIKKVAIAGHPPLSSVNDITQAYYLNEDVSLYLKGPLSDEEIERIYHAVIAIDNNNVKTAITDALRNTSPVFRESCTYIVNHVGDQVAKLNNLQVPIAIIHASKDQAIQWDYLDKLQIMNLWEQKIQLIPDCGHLCIIEKPEELAELLDRFFSEIVPTASYSSGLN